MKHTPEHSLRGLRALTLSDAAFLRIRSTLASYADMHAVVDGVNYVRTYPALAWLGTRQSLYAFTFIGLAMIGSGSVSLGAERAVPGEALYAVKIHLNEAVSASFANSYEEKARYSAKLATRRATEAVLLAEEGKLDAETAAYLDEQVTLHVTESDSNAASLESEGDVGTALAVRSELEEKLTATAAALEEPIEETAIAFQVEQADMATMSMKMASPESQSPRAQLAQHIGEKARFLAAARRNTAAGVFPGFITIEERGIDFTLLRQAKEEMGNGEVSQPSMSLTATGSATSTEEVVIPESPKDAPSIMEARKLDVTESIWFRSSQ